MKFAICVGIIALLMRVMIGGVSPSSEISLNREDEFTDAEPLVSDDPYSLIDRNSVLMRTSSPEWLTKMSKNGLRSQMLPLEDGDDLTDFKGGPLVGAKRLTPWFRMPSGLPNRRAFNPWGGKRVFNPWGGKRLSDIYLERKENTIFDKRPGFQPWGGKRGYDTESEGSWSSEKRAFSPWGGKRRSPVEQNEFVDEVDPNILMRNRQKNRNKILSLLP